MISMSINDRFGRGTDMGYMTPKANHKFRLDLVKAVISWRRPEAPPDERTSDIDGFCDFVARLENVFQDSLSEQEKIDRSTQERVIETLRRMSRPDSAAGAGAAQSALTTALMEAAEKYANHWIGLREKIRAQSQREAARSLLAN